jgi:hypothetical protein
MSIKLNHTRKNQSGAALVIALIIMIVLTLIGLASTFTSTFEISLSGNKRGSTDAFYAADAGVQAALANPANFNTSSYTLIPNSSGLPIDLRNEGIVRRLSPAALWLPAGVNFDYPPQVTVYYMPSFGGHGTQGGTTTDSYIIDSIGRDQIGSGVSRSSSRLREKWVMHGLDDPNNPGGP